MSTISLEWMNELQIFIGHLLGIRHYRMHELYSIWSSQLYCLVYKWTNVKPGEVDSDPESFGLE